MIADLRIVTAIDKTKKAIPLCTTNYVALCRIYEVYGVYFKLSQIIYHSL